MLKGKKVLIDDYFGTVLNHAEKESVLILQVVRERVSRYNSQDPISRIAGVPHVERWWKVTKKIVAVPWQITGPVVVCSVMPEFLHVRNLR